MNKIIISEQSSSGRTVIIPVLPEKIEFKANGTRFVTYEVLDLGEVQIPSGENLRSFRWTSIFPGENHFLPFMSVSEPLAPKEYQTILSEWKAYGTPLKLLILGTPINHHVYLKDYNVDYSGAWGDYEYTVEFIDRRQIQVTSTKNQKSNTQKRITATTKTYTVVKGDTLWGIARRFLGSGTRHTEIYQLNKDAIEATAKKYGKKSSNNGWWIYPGTTLHIPS